MKKAQKLTKQTIPHVTPKNYFERMAIIQNNLETLKSPYSKQLKDYIEYGYKQSLKIPIVVYAEDERWDIYIDRASESFGRTSVLSIAGSEGREGYVSRIAGLAERQPKLIAALEGKRLAISKAQDHEFDHGLVLKHLYFAWADACWRQYGYLKSDFSLSRHQLMRWVKRHSADHP
jgi:hypothetical protein